MLPCGRNGQIASGKRANPPGFWGDLIEKLHSGNAGDFERIAKYIEVLE